MTTEKYDPTLPREILLSDEVARREKTDREFKIYVKLEPIIRILAIALVSALAIVHSLLGATNFKISTILFFSFLSFVVEGGITWILLWFYWRAHPMIYEIVSVLDFLFMTVGIYFTGGESSFIFFIYITRVADQITVKDRKRILYFSVLAPLFYSAMLLYISAFDHRDINFQIEMIKMLSLFGASIYLMVVGRSVGNIKGRMVAFLRAAKTAYRLLEERKSELEVINDKKNKILGTVAHDIRSSLNVVKGFVELTIQDISDNRFDPVPGKKDLETVLIAAQQMTRLVSDLLDISAIESGKLTLNCMEISMESVLEGCVDFLSRSAHKKNIAMTVDPAALLPKVWGDRQRLMSVVDNLVSNAIKYTRTGGQIHIGFEQNNADIVMHVSDTGLGLSEQDLENIFSYFTRLGPKPTGGESSTGLGLAIAKKIIELHNGRIWVKSTQGQGSTFSFSVPIYKPA
jgi:signal transduction histidine kinase